LCTLLLARSYIFVRSHEGVRERESEDFMLVGVKNILVETQECCERACERGCERQCRGNGEVEQVVK
jgi:hypothetical protein